MFNFQLFFTLVAVICGVAGCATSGIDIERFQPPITNRNAPERPITQYSLYNNTTKVGLAEMRAQVPAFNGKGDLIASWTPHREGTRNRPTFVMVYGTDPSQTFVWGDSQGGWTVLRAFTEDTFIKQQVEHLYRGGIAAYPNCFSHGTPEAPKLSPYFAPVIVFTGGKDSATPISECPQNVLTSAILWVHYPDQTHGWDTANRGASGTPADGECGRAMNIYNQFPVCRSDRTTNDMRQRIKEFVVQRVHEEYYR